MIDQWREIVLLDVTRRPARFLLLHTDRHSDVWRCSYVLTLVCSLARALGAYAMSKRSALSRQ